MKIINNPNIKGNDSMSRDIFSGIKDKTEWRKLSTFIPNKRLPIYNWFYYKEGYARDLVFSVMDMFGLGAGNCVLDPFSGSGTTLLACKEKGINSIGFDVLPISVFASKVKTADYNIEELKKFTKIFFSKKFEKPKDIFPANFRKFFLSHTIDDVLFFLKEVKSMDNDNVKNFLLLGLISSAMKCSYVYKDGNVLKIKKHPIAPFRKFYRWYIKKMIRDLKKFNSNTTTEKIGNTDICFGDARNIDLPQESVDAVITSPPYLNNIDYTNVYSIENWFLGEPNPPMRSYLGLGDAEIQRKYFEDMKRVLKNLYEICRPGAKLGFVVGNAYINDSIVDVDTMISDLGEKLGFKKTGIFILNNRFALKRRTIKVGNLRESLITLEK